MDYESRQVKWYWLGLFIAFCAGSLYLLFLGNPYLYSHIELRTLLTSGELKSRGTVPTKPETAALVGQPTHFARFNFERTGIDPLPSPRSRSYEEFEKHPVALTDFDAAHVSYDSTGFFVTSEGPWVAAVGPDGKLLWRYKFLSVPEGKGIQPVLLDEAHAYLIHPAGDIVALDKRTGQLRWLLELKADILAQVFVWQDALMVPLKTGSGIQLVPVNRQDGKIGTATPKLDLKPNFSVSHAPALEALIFTSDSKVSAIDPNEWDLIWSQTLTDPVLGPALVVEHQIVVATLGAKIVKLDGGRKGKVDWEADLEKPAVTTPAFLPIMGRISWIDTAGGLHVLDLKTGKPLWRTQMDGKSPNMESWSTRLKAQNIEEFKMDWLHKGWTVWAYCQDRRVCMYTPNKGQLIERLHLSAAPLALPLALDRRLVFFTRGKGNQPYAVIQAVEETEAKKLRAAAAKLKD